jgi:outer membrane protein assembly factor BamB
VPTYRSAQPPRIILSQTVIYAIQGGIYALEEESGGIQKYYAIQGFTSSAIFNENIYINQPREGVVLALHVRNGKQVWRYKVEGILCSAPIVIDDILYVSTNEGNIYALHAIDGSPLWRYKASSLLVTSPTVHEGMLYVSLAANSPSFVFVPGSSVSQISQQPSICALGAKDGLLLWQSQISTATTFPLTVTDEAVYVSTQNSCVALRVTDGALLWQQSVEGFCRSEPVVIDEMLLISSSVFKSARSTSQHGSVRQWQDVFLTALRTRDGSLYWQKQLRINGDPLDKGTDKPSAPLGGDPTTPFIVDDVIYVGVGGVLFALRLDDGTPLWHYHTDGTFLSSPQATGEVVYVGANDGYVYALRANNGTILWRTYLA